MKRLVPAFVLGALFALLVGAASPQGPLTSPIAQTVGATSATYSISIPTNAGCALFLEVVGYSTTGDFAYFFKNLGVKNVGGTVTTYSLPANLLSIGTVDLTMTLASASVSTGAGTLVVTMTGVSGLTVNWQAFWTQKCTQP